MPRRHVYIVSHMCQTVTLFNASDSSSRGDSSASLFQATASLPTAEETGLRDTVTQLANATVLLEVQAQRPWKRKPYTVCTAEQRATYGKYASEHGNTAAVKKFKTNIEGG